METLKNVVNEFKDPKLLMILLGIGLLLILLRILSNFFLHHKLIKVAIVGGILICLIMGVFWFVDNRKDFYSNSSRYYVYGEVKNVSSTLRKIDLSVIKSNVKDNNLYNLEYSNVIVDIDINCKILDDLGKEISLGEIEILDTVQIFVKESSIKDLSNYTLSGIKIIQKSKYSK